MRRFIYRLCIAVVVLFVGCYNNFTEKDFNGGLPLRTTTIANLKAQCSEGYTIIDKHIVCVGQVVSSDQEGNFYRSLFVEDETGAVEVLVGIYDSYSHYPLGTSVALKLNGCAAEYRDGVLQVGLPKNSYDRYLREFESQVLLDKHILRGNTSPATPHECEVATIEASQCGCLIRIDNLRHAPLTDEVCDNITGYHRFVTPDNSDIYCSVSEYAKFATMAIPEGDIAIVGILKYESISEVVGEKFVLYPRSRGDLLDGAQDLDE